MKWSNFSYKNSKTVIKKLSLEKTESKRGREPIYWYYLDGKKELRVSMPNQHGGSGSVSTGYITQIRNQLKLGTREFEDLVDCPLSAEKFEALIRERTK